jgi:transcriptional regulator with XRE-family HTH domain
MFHVWRDAMSEQFRTYLARQLLRREWTQADLARRSGLSPGRISEWMHGKRIPSPESCDRLADALGVDVDDLLVVAGHRPKERSNDPETAALASLLWRIRWTPDRRAVIRGALESMRDRDRAREASA